MNEVSGFLFFIFLVIQIISGVIPAKSYIGKDKPEGYLLSLTIYISMVLKFVPVINLDLSTVLTVSVF